MDFKNVDYYQFVPAEEDIEDKGKSDWFAKSVVVFQTLWFVVQFIVRQTNHLPVTHLETITLAYAVLNFLTYLFWWNKPLKVDRPIRVTQTRVTQTELPVIEETHPVTEETRPIPEETQLITEEARSAEETHPVTEETRPIPEETQLITEVTRSAEETHPVTEETHPVTEETRPITEETHPRVQERTSEATWKAIGERLVKITHFIVGLQDRDVDLSREDRVPMFWADCKKPATADTIVAVVGVCFGLIHIIAWNYSFPTHIELCMWRISSIVITVVPVFIPFMFIVAGSLGGLLGLQGPAYVALISAPIIGGILYISARGFTLVLAFTSLRELPPGVYETVHEITSILHI